MQTRKTYLPFGVSSYFQNIPEDRFTSDASFLVKESKTMHVIIGVVLLVLAIVMFRSSIVMGIVVGVFSLASFLAGKRAQTVMKINQDGFFYYGALVTNWDHFVSARFLDELPFPSSSSTGISDQFYLSLRYYKEGRPECFERKIRLTNTQDKSEEEILAAIRFYYKNSQVVK